ncbi:ribosomal L1 domain-containing protein CG13096-like isoform X1 [Sitodiplosis mosellana]|nr:ribosomal L1 domain-containing protein CG13096-like isoform X1 [Sitodiplosis mosellana]XP_055307761.1 ribosomal L1 domain-containing protein CG13096-like isoform X1 [Sitodiplosis mosellana]
MDETSPTPPPVAPKRRGRKPKNPLAGKANAATPAKTEASDGTKADDKNNETNPNESIEKADKPEKLSLSERKQAKKAQIEAIIASGGRGKRTPKPNPKYMDEPVVSASKHGKDDELDHIEGGEDGDDEMNLSSDDLPRNEGPLKKRMLQKIGMKSGPGRKPGSGKGTPGRKPAGFVAIKRKLEVDIDIDDEHGKQLFLDAKRRFQNSPSGSEDDAQLKKSKSPITDALAAKLRSKYPNDFIIKRTIAMDSKASPINRARLVQTKIAVQKDGALELRKRKLTEETETSEDDFGSGRGTSDQDTSSAKNINRRKTQHTKILSDDKLIRPSSSGAPTTIIRKQIGSSTVVRQINKSPLAQNQLIQSKLQGATSAKTYSISAQSRVIGTNKPAILRQPPRILNSTLCKPTNKVTVPSLVTKVVTKDDYENELNKKRNNNIISSRSKENNVTSYVYTEKDGKMIPKKQIVQASPQKLVQQRKAVLPVVRTPSTQQRIISEPVSMNIPNSRRIRKITCFETWYVIKMAEEQPKVEKSILNLSLMQIGNEIKKIELPSSEWTYKILLQPLNKQLLALRQTKAIEKATEKKSAATEESNEKSDSDSNTESKGKDTKSDEKKEESKDNIKEESSKEDESTKTPQDEPKTEDTEESASADDDNDEEKKDEKKADDNKDEEKPKLKAELKSEDGAENKSSESSAEEEKEQKSDVAVKKEKDETPANTSIVHEVYTGEVHDPNINPDERQNYRPINIMFRRKCQNPNIRIQFDRTVILKNQTFYLNVDGKNVRLVASPQKIETYEDIATLLQIVNDISLNSCCVELATHIG